MVTCWSGWTLRRSRVDAASEGDWGQRLHTTSSHLAAAMADGRDPAKKLLPRAASMVVMSIEADGMSHIPTRCDPNLRAVDRHCGICG